MNDVSSRFSEFYKTLKISQIDFCKKTKVNKSVLSNILCEKPSRKISFGMILKIKRFYPELDLNWLLSGQDSMIKNSYLVNDEQVGVKMMLEKIDALVRENQELRRKLNI